MKPSPAIKEQGKQLEKDFPDWKRQEQEKQLDKEFPLALEKELHEARIGVAKVRTPPQAEVKIPADKGLPADMTPHTTYRITEPTLKAKNPNVELIPAKNDKNIISTQMKQNITKSKRQYETVLATKMNVLAELTGQIADLNATIGALKAAEASFAGKRGRWYLKLLKSA